MWRFTDHTAPASDTAGFCKKKTCRCASLWLSSSQAAVLHELHTTPGSWALAYSSPKWVEITREPVNLSSIEIHARRETLLPWAKAEMEFFTSPIVFPTLKSPILPFAKLYETFLCLDDWNEPNQETETGIVQKYEKEYWKPDNDKKSWDWRKGWEGPLTCHDWLWNGGLRERQWTTWQWAILYRRTGFKWANSHWAMQRH